MKIYFLADCHIDCKGGNSIWLDDYVGYFENVFIPYCKSHVKDDDILVCLGDWFDNRTHVTMPAISKSIMLFEQFSMIFNDIRIIVGNHDIYNKHNNLITSVDIFKYIKNVKIYYSPTLENIGTKSVLFMPWVEDNLEQKKVLKFYDADYVFGHMEISGLVMNAKGVKSGGGEDEVQYTDFKKAEVYAGHIHTRQDFKNIHYVGCPYMKDRGDMGNTKGITVLDIESGKTEFIENTYSPKFIRVSIYDVLDKSVDDLKKEWKNNYVDFVVKGDDILACNFEPLREVMKDTYKEFNLIADNSESTIKQNDIDLTDAKSSKDMIYDYINQIEVDESMRNSVKEWVEKIIERVKQ